MRFGGVVRAAAAAALALGSVACSGTTTAPLVDLSGTYGLVSIQFGTGTTALTPSTETGSLSLSTTTYDLTLSGAQPETDSGTYSTSGSNWNQQSSVNGTQSVGTYTLSGTTLSVSTMQGGVAVVSVWQKLS